MKKIYWVSSLFWITCILHLQAQPAVSAKGINVTSVNFRGAPMVLAQIDLNIQSSGTVVVHFDGEGYLDVGDRLIVAANDAPSWNSNDGNVGLETSSIYIGKSFSHTRTFHYFDGDHGIRSFYAVAENYADKGGSGIGSIYGTLTVEFFADSGPTSVHSNGFIFSGDVTNPVVVSQQTIHAPSAGKVIVRFDGSCQSTVGDRIVLAASNTNTWLPNDGNVSVEAIADHIDLSPFSHTREYDVPAAGDYTYYAVAQNYAETDGSGMIYVYGNFIVEFYPAAGPDIIAFQGFSQLNADLHDQFYSLSSVMINTPGPGTVIVDFDGDFTSDPGDYVEIGASSYVGLPVDDGNTKLVTFDSDVNRNCFAHSRFYPVNAGPHTYHAIGKTFSGDPGTGIINLFGELTVKYFPDQSTAVEDVANSKNDFTVFPDPSPGMITISFSQDARAELPINLFDNTGHMLKQYRHAGTAELTIDISSLPEGLYWIEVGDKVKPVVKL
jgi:hypothetical protein